MPFKSQAQRRYMHAMHPKMAKEFESKTRKKKLPEHVKNKNYTKEAVAMAMAKING